MSQVQSRTHIVKATLLSSVGATALAAAMSLGATGPAQAVCGGPPGTPAPTQTQCLTAVAIPGNPLRSFDISWVNTSRGEYYLADRSNAGIDVLTTAGPAFSRTITGGVASFVGIVLTTSGAVNNNQSGPDGVVSSRGHWLYAGDGDSTLKVIDLNIPGPNAIVQSISTGGTTRVDEMALTGNGRILLGANNAEDPPFGTLFNTNSDNATTSNVSIFAKIFIDPTLVPPGAGGSIEQPTWEPNSARFYVSVPQIANNPTGCTFGPGGNACQGGLLVVDPTTLSGTVTLGLFNVGPLAGTNTGVILLNACSPNGATVGRNQNLLLGCNPGNVGTNVTTLVINAVTHNYANIGNITGADEVWYNSGDQRYYLGASRNCKTYAVGSNPPPTCPTAGSQQAVLGVIDSTSVLIETIPQSSASHSVAADSTLNRIFVPQVAPSSVVGSGGDTTTVGAGICGTTNGCIAVYQH
jgi:hypothetical protein